MKKVIVLTGASSGIGKATALALSHSPHVLVLMARDKKKLEKIAAGLECPVMVLPTDVTDTANVQHNLNEVVTKLGGIDVLINNAGLGNFDPIDQGKLEEWHNMIDVNFKGLLTVLHTCLPHLKSSKDGQVINVASVAAHQVFPNSGVYCATKHAVLAVSHALQLELSKELKVTTISPGAVNTPFVEQTSNSEMLNNLREYFAAGLDPTVIAEQIVHCLEQPKNVTISEIIVRPKRS